MVNIKTLLRNFSFSRITRFVLVLVFLGFTQVTFAQGGSLEQLSRLKEQFDSQLRQGNIESAEKYLDQAVKIEQQDSTLTEKPSITMQLEIGHYYLNKLKETDPNANSAPAYLRESIERFTSIIEQNNHQRIDEVMLPYGELAMASYLGNNIVRKAEFFFDEDDLGDGSAEPNGQGPGASSETAQRVRVSAPEEDLLHNDYLNRVVPNTLEVLKVYYRKAYDEENVVEALYAVLALGDLNFSVGREEIADQYYKVAWNVGSVLPSNHPRRLGLSQPSPIPNFNYAYSPNISVESAETMNMPLKFDVNQKGQLDNITSVSDDDKEFLSKARRELRGMIFRPALNNGERISQEDYEYVLSMKTN